MGDEFSCGLVRRGSFPAMVVYVTHGIGKWFVAGADAPRALFPKANAGRNTVAGDLMHQDNTGPTAVRAGGWLTHARAHCYEATEDSV
jgi:hypothetical protein